MRVAGAIGILPVVGDRPVFVYPAGQIGSIAVDASIDNPDPDVSSGDRVLVRAVEGQESLIYPVQWPPPAALRRVTNAGQWNGHVRFDIGHVRITLQ
jgi:hypothetical protein